MARTGLETPKLVARSRIESKKIAFWITSEHKVAGGCQHRGKQNQSVGHAPDALAGNWIPRIHVAVGCAIRRQFHGEVAVHEGPPLVGLVIVRRNVRANLVGGGVNETGARRVGHRVPALCAGCARAERSGFTQLGFVAADEFTVLGYSGNPIE